MLSSEYLCPQIGQNHLTQSLFYNCVLNISCNLLNTVLKVVNRLSEYRIVVMVVYPIDWDNSQIVSDWELLRAALPSITREYCIAYH